MIAVIVFAGGQDVYNDPDLHYGLKSVYNGSRYIDNAGWYMDEVQPWATFCSSCCHCPIRKLYDLS